MEVEEAGAEAAWRRKRRRVDGISHHVLSVLYPPSPSSLGICTLRDFMLALSSSQHPQASSRSVLLEEGMLVRDEDPAEYLSLLHGGYAALPSSAPSLGTISLEQHWTLEQVIERVIQLQFRQGNNALNVICFGFQEPRPRFDIKTDKIALAGLDCAFGNAAVMLLNTQAWRILHSRVGDRIMLYILTYADVFHPLLNGCLIQVAGTSVITYVRPPVDSLHLDACSWLGGTKISGAFDVEDASKTPTPNSSCSEMMDSISKRSIKHFNSLFCTDVFMGLKKCRRPFSWQRRKARKVCPEQNETMMNGSWNDIGSMPVMRLRGMIDTAQKLTENGPVSQANANQTIEHCDCSGMSSKFTCPNKQEQGLEVHAFPLGTQSAKNTNGLPGATFVVLAC